MLGAWLAFTYFTLVRIHVHDHVKSLTTGQTNSSNKIYYLISTGIFLGFTLVVTLTFIINMNKDIRFPGDQQPPGISPKKWTCAQLYDFWNTWAESAYMAAGLGGYFGILYQNKKYGGQLFIQQKID